MELVKEYVGHWEGRQVKTIQISGMGGTMTSDGNVRVFIGDREVGQLQSIHAEHVRPTVERTERFQALPIEGTLTMAEVNHDVLALLGQEASFSMSVQYDWEQCYVAQSRAERRKEEFKPRQKQDEEERGNNYHKGIRQMMGGRKKWN